MLQLSLFFLASLAYINWLLPLGLELRNSLNKDSCARPQVLPKLVGPPGVLYSTIPVLFPQVIHSWGFAWIILPPLSPKSNHQLPLLLFSKYLFCFIYFLGPCDRVERTWSVYSKDFCSNTVLPTCWPCGIECFLPLLPPPPPFSTSILSSTTWTAWPFTQIHLPELCAHFLPHYSHFSTRVDALNYLQ